MKLKCPVCQEALIQETKRYICPQGHQFDRAKTGYVNLLQSQRQKQKNRGDDKAMVDARTAFLDTGSYTPFRDKLFEIVEREAGKDILDVGCGEGWYASPFVESGYNVSGIDISKFAIEKASKRHPKMTLAVASSTALPFINESFDVVYCVFAPFDLDEIARVLKPGGIFIDVYALEDHLLDLKTILYPSVYPNQIKIYEHTAFNYEGSESVDSHCELVGQTMIHNLFGMTPYAHRTPKEGMNALNALEQLKTRIGFGFGIYRKK